MKQQKKRDGRKERESREKYTSAEVTEMMQSMEEIRKQQQHQDKIAGYLAIPVILLIVAVFKFSGHANLGGALFAGLLGAGAAVSGYYLWVNREDRESKRIYGFFTITLTGIFFTICSFLVPDGFWEQHRQEASLITCLVNLASVIYAFGFAVKRMCRKKKEPGTYCCCGGSGDFDNGVDFTWLCCQVHRKCHGNQQGGCGRTVRNTAVAQ